MPPGEECDDRYGCGHHRESPHRPIEIAAFDQWEDEKRHRNHDEARTDEVEFERVRRFAVREIASCHNEGDDTDWYIDQEDWSPVEIPEIEMDQDAANDWPETCSDTRHRTEDTHHLATLVRFEHDLHHTHDLWHHECGCRSLEEARDDQDFRIPRGTTNERCECKSGDAPHEDLFVSKYIPHATPCDEHDRERERITSNEPLDGRVAGAEIGLDRWNRNIDDGIVEQVHDKRHSDDDQGNRAPAMAEFARVMVRGMSRVFSRHI